MSRTAPHLRRALPVLFLAATPLLCAGCGGSGGSPTASPGGGGGGAASCDMRLRDGLVVAQLTMSMMLLIGASLMVSTLLMVFRPPPRA